MNARLGLDQPEGQSRPFRHRPQLLLQVLDQEQDSDLPARRPCRRTPRRKLQDPDYVHLALREALMEALYQWRSQTPKTRARPGLISSAGPQSLPLMLMNLLSFLL
ncbi:hypothetical protein ABKV19_014088 [Rosa sericea]